LRRETLHRHLSVVEDLGGGGGGQCQHPLGAAELAETRQLEVVRTEIMTPFGDAVGLVVGIANTRLQVVAGAEHLYEALLAKQVLLFQDDVEANGDVLLFRTIARIALQGDGVLNRDVARDLVTLFRPSREGTLCLLDFCKSIDSLYKDTRLLRANIANEAKLNAASEKIFSVGFFFVLSECGNGVGWPLYVVL